MGNQHITLFKGDTAMEQQQTQASSERMEQEQFADARQTWQQPKLERLQISLDTALTKGSGSDGGASTGP